MIAELQAVSDSWLGKQVEKGFSLGFFDEDYLNEAPVCLIRDASGKLVAFASMMPMDEKTLSIDLMRHSQDAPSGIMDKIFISLFEYGKEQGYEYFDMGMAPYQMLVNHALALSVNELRALSLNMVIVSMLFKVYVPIRTNMLRNGAPNIRLIGNGLR